LVVMADRHCRSWREGRGVAQMMTADEVGKLLKLSTYTVRELARKGRLPVCRLIPGRLRFDRDEVLAAVRGATVPAVALSRGEG
jgi:excisionase family DNA binding protein